MDVTLVKAARQEEADYIRRMKLYAKVPISECVKQTGKQPVDTRWIDINKQDEFNPLYLSRLVGQEFTTSVDSSLHAATPPLESLKTIISIAATTPRHTKLPLKIMVNDVSRHIFMHLLHLAS